MRGLRQFLHFDLPAFLAGKRLVVTSVSKMTDFDSGAVVGTKVECAITRDDTEYQPAKDGSKVSNLYEKVTIKIKLPHTASADVGTEVTPINAVATVYGDYQNKLSITADGLEVVQGKSRG